MSGEKLKQFDCEGKNIPVNFVESVEVVSGVRCDVYRFPEDETRDLGIIYIEAACKTPQQRVLNGEKTIEGFYAGKGKLTITKENGEKEIYEVDDESGKGFFKEIKVGEIMQWQAASDSGLVAYEVCYPPYQTGRYEDLL